MKTILQRLKPDKEHINSLPQMMESLWSYVPSSTDKNQLVDISLYDHSRTTAAIASAIYDYFQAENITDYQKNYLIIMLRNFMIKMPFDDEF